MDEGKPRPIPPMTVLIRGVMGRSGTNYLRDALALHPMCGKSRAPVWEDFFLDEASHLTRFADGVASRWPEKWGIDSEATREALLASIGNGLREFLHNGVPEPVALAKTPSTVGIEHHFRLFPSSPLILLVRDGRAVIRSAMRSFGWSFERALQSWLDGAQRIVAFDRRFGSTHAARYRIVRYEDLVSDPQRTLGDLCGLMGIAADDLDVGAVERLPARGSSTLDGGRGLHWQPVERDGSFDPTTRAVELTRRQEERFWWAAGDCMRHLGYEVPEPGGRRHHLTQSTESVFRGLQRGANGAGQALRQSIRANRS